MRLSAIALLLALTACHATHRETEQASPEPEASSEALTVDAPLAGSPQTTTQTITQTDGPQDVEAESAPPAHSAKAPAPTSKAWERAVVFPLARNQTNCEARRFGEFIRVGCQNIFSSLDEQLAGDPVGVKFGSVKRENPFAETNYVVFPLRRGDRRVIQLGSIEGGWKFGWSVSAPALISAAWIDGETDPQVVID